jgi:hypothetical protein
MSGFEFKTVTREKVKLKIAITGPSGAGKTYSAIQLARGIASSDEKIAFLDTENSSASYYANLGAFQHCDFSAPYTPERFIEAINGAVEAGFEVIIIDSISHEWAGPGGCLEQVEEVKKQHNIRLDMQVWKYITPRHNAFIDALRESPIHLIGCIRSKQDYEIEKNDKGKVEIKKLGLKGIQREGLDYEMGLTFDLNMNHYATSSKDRTGLFMDRDPFLITTETGNELLTWANTGADPVYNGSNIKHMQELAKICVQDFKFNAEDDDDKKKMRDISESLDGSATLPRLKERIGEFITATGAAESTSDAGVTH